MSDLNMNAPAEGADADAPSIADTMSEVFDRMQADDGDDAPADPGAPAEKASDGPARGADGKFVAKDTAAPEAAKDKPAGAEKAAAGKQDDTGAPAAGKATPVAPASMTAEEKAAFEKLPPDAKAFLARRESDLQAHLTRGSQELAESKRRYAALDQVIEPRRQAWAMERMSPEMAVSQLLAISDKANADPAGFIQWFAGQRGIDLAQLTAARAEPEYVDPHLAELRKQVGSLTSRLSSEDQARQNAALGQIQQTVQAFEQEKDAQGNLAHPHYAKLEAEIAHTIRALRQSEPGLSHRDALQKAYDRAVWANPETRALLQAAAETAAAEKRRAEEADRVARAKRTAGTSLSNRGAVAGSSSGAARSISETMEEVYDRLNGAA